MCALSTHPFQVNKLKSTVYSFTHNVTLVPRPHNFTDLLQFMGLTFLTSIYLLIIHFPTYPSIY